MSDQKKKAKSEKQVKSQRLDLKSAWGIELEAATCDHCYLLSHCIQLLFFESILELGVNNLQHCHTKKEL